MPITTSGLIRRALMEASDSLSILPGLMRMGGVPPADVGAFLTSIERLVSGVRSLRTGSFAGQGTFMFVARGEDPRLLPCPLCSTLVVSGELHHCDSGVAHAPGRNPFSASRQLELLRVKAAE